MDNSPLRPAFLGIYGRSFVEQNQHGQRPCVRSAHIYIYFSFSIYISINKWTLDSAFFFFFIPWKLKRQKKRGQWGHLSANPMMLYTISHVHEHLDLPDYFEIGGLFYISAPYFPAFRWTIFVTEG